VGRLAERVDVINTDQLIQNITRASSHGDRVLTPENWDSPNLPDFRQWFTFGTSVPRLRISR
jgi:hypothetical protein